MKKNKDKDPIHNKKRPSKTSRGLKPQQAKLLLNVSETMAAFETLDGMLAVLVDMATREMDAERSTIFLNDSDTNELYSRVAQGNFTAKSAS